MKHNLIAALNACGIQFNKISIEIGFDTVDVVGFKLKGDKKIVLALYNNDKRMSTYTVLSQNKYLKLKDFTELEKSLTKANHELGLSFVKAIETKLNSIKDFNTYTLDMVAINLLNN